LTIKAIFSKESFGDHSLAWKLSRIYGTLSLSWSYSVQLLKIDLGSFLEHFASCSKLEEGGFGRQGSATIEVWSFSSF